MLVAQVVTMVEGSLVEIGGAMAGVVPISERLEILCQIGLRWVEEVVELPGRCRVVAQVAGQLVDRVAVGIVGVRVGHKLEAAAVVRRVVVVLEMEGMGPHTAIPITAAEVEEDIMVVVVEMREVGVEVRVTHLVLLSPTIREINQGTVFWSFRLSQLDQHPNHPPILLLNLARNLRINPLASLPDVLPNNLLDSPQTNRRRNLQDAQPVDPACSLRNSHHRNLPNNHL